MTRREITRHGWNAQDAARAERMRTERAGTDPVAEPERIPWKGQPTPWLVAGVDVQRVTETRTFLMRPGADGVTSEPIGFPFTEPTP